MKKTKRKILIVAVQLSINHLDLKQLKNFVLLK